MSKLLLGSESRTRLERFTLGSNIVAPFITAYSDLSDLTHWYDASDTGSITQSGGAVSNWANQIGGTNSLEQASAGAKPTTGTRTQNGLNCLDFDGTGDWMWSGEWLWANRVAGSTILICYVPDTISASQTLITSSRTVSNHTRWRIGTFNSTFYRPFHDYARDDGAVTATLLGPSAVAATTPYVVAVTQQVTNDSTSLWTIGTNGEARASATNFTTNGAATTPDVVMVGASRWNSPNTFLDGKLCEIVRWGGIKSEADLLMGIAFMMTKWAV